jgi:hypothetical protein
MQLLVFVQVLGGAAECRFAGNTDYGPLNRFQPP